MFAVALQGVVAPELIGVVDRAFPGFPTDDVHEDLLGDNIHDLRVDPSIPFQEPENDAFAGSSSPAFSFPPAAEVRLVQFDLSREFSRLHLTLLDDREPELVIDALHGLVWDAEIDGGQEGGLLATEGAENEDLAFQPLQTLLPFAVPALPVSAPRPIGLAMTAVDALPSQQE